MWLNIGNYCRRTPLHFLYLKILSLLRDANSAYCCKLGHFFFVTLADEDGDSLSRDLFQTFIINCATSNRNTELAVLSSAIAAATVRPTLALCLITKDKFRDLLEWVEYHYSIGVSKVIIVDNNSSISVI